MRTISEQKLKEILDKHGKWVRGDTGGEQADLRSANLRSADLSFADLSHADLSFADLTASDLTASDLSYSDLSSVDLKGATLNDVNLRCVDLAVFRGSRDRAHYTFDGAIGIGCYLMPVSEWLLGFEEIGKENGYSELEIKRYGNFIKRCAAHFKGMK